MLCGAPGWQFVEGGANLTDRALALNPNLAWALLFSGWVQVWIGEPEVAIERFARAMRLSPQDPLFFQMQAGTALAHFCAGRYSEASTWAEAAVREQRSFLLVLCTAAASNALAGRAARRVRVDVAHDAGKAMTRLRQLDPNLRLSNIRNLLTLRRPSDIAKWEEGLRNAGLPE